MSMSQQEKKQRKDGDQVTSCRILLNILKRQTVFKKFFYEDKISDIETRTKKKPQQRKEAIESEISLMNIVAKIIYKTQVI